MQKVLQMTSCRILIGCWHICTLGQKLNNLVVAIFFESSSHSNWNELLESPSCKTFSMVNSTEDVFGTSYYTYILSKKSCIARKSSLRRKKSLLAGFKNFEALAAILFCFVIVGTLCFPLTQEAHTETTKIKKIKSTCGLNLRAGELSIC